MTLKLTNQDCSLKGNLDHLVNRKKIEGSVKLEHYISFFSLLLHQLGPVLKPENMHHVGSSLPNAFANGGSLLHIGMHNPVEKSAHVGRIDATRNMLSTHNSNMGLIQGVNGEIIKSEVGGMIKPEVGGIIKSEVGGIIKSEVGFSSSSPYMFDNNILKARQSIGEASVPPFNGVDSNTQTLNESHLNTSSFGFLGHIPRNFSLSDLTNDFSQSLVILEEESRSPNNGQRWCMEVSNMAQSFHHVPEEEEKAVESPLLAAKDNEVKGFDLNMTP
ncbi:hypothetical protein UlMin_019756 [Ulmus minor]